MPQNQSISKIYSRRRIRKFKPRKYNWHNHKNGVKKSKIGLLFTICIIALVVYIVMTKSVEPVFNKICSNEARSIATKIINDESNKVLEDYTYNDLYTIQSDSSR